METDDFFAESRTQDEPDQQKNEQEIYSCSFFLHLYEMFTNPVVGL